MRKVIKGYISVKDAMSDRDTLLAIVWETPIRDMERGIEAREGKQK